MDLAYLALAVVLWLAVVGLADAWGTPKYGVIDRSGKLVVPAIYSYARAYENGLAFVMDEGARDLPT